MDKMSRVNMVSFCNLIGTARARRRKSTTFPADVTRISPPPPSFLRREPGDDARGWRRKEEGEREERQREKGERREQVGRKKGGTKRKGRKEERKKRREREERKDEKKK